MKGRESVTIGTPEEGQQTVNPTRGSGRTVQLKEKDE